MQYESAVSAVKEARANMAQLDNMLDYMNLTSDVSGMVAAYSRERSNCSGRADDWDIGAGWQYGS